MGEKMRTNLIKCIYFDAFRTIDQVIQVATVNATIQNLH